MTCSLLQLEIGRSAMLNPPSCLVDNDIMTRKPTTNPQWFAKTAAANAGPTHRVFRTPAWSPSSGLSSVRLFESATRPFKSAAHPCKHAWRSWLSCMDPHAPVELPCSAYHPYSSTDPDRDAPDALIVPAECREKACRMARGNPVCRVNDITPAIRSISLISPARHASLLTGMPAQPRLHLQIAHMHPAQNECTPPETDAACIHGRKARFAALMIKNCKAAPSNRVIPSVNQQILQFCSKKFQFLVDTSFLLPYTVSCTSERELVRA